MKDGLLGEVNHFWDVHGCFRAAFDAGFDFLNASRPLLSKSPSDSRKADAP